MALERQGGEFEQMFLELEKPARDLMEKASKLLEQIKDWPQDRKDKFWEALNTRVEQDETGTAGAVDGALEVADILRRRKERGE